MSARFKLFTGRGHVPKKMVVAKVLWDFESLNFINGLLRTEPDRVRGYLEQLDRWLRAECVANDLDKRVYCFGTSHRHFADMLEHAGWIVVAAGSAQGDNALREEVNVSLFSGATGVVFVFITNDAQYLTEIRNVERHGARAVVVGGEALGEFAHASLASVMRRPREGTAAPPMEGRIYAAKRCGKNEVLIFPSMRRGRIMGEHEHETSGKVVVMVRRVYGDHIEVELRDAPTPHEHYVATVRGEPFHDRVRVSIAHAHGWGGMIYLKPPFNGLPPGKKPSDYHDGDELVVELIASRERGKIFRIV